MKLLMENWNNYLAEEKIQEEIRAYLAENNIILTEQQLLELKLGDWTKVFGGFEGLKKAAKKVGGAAALIAILSSALAPGIAQAGDPFAAFAELDAAMTEMPATQVDAPAAMPGMPGLDDPATMGKTAPQPPADMAAAEASLANIEGELAKESDEFKRLDINMKYGVKNTIKDGTGTFKITFETSDGKNITLTKVPMQNYPQLAGIK